MLCAPGNAGIAAEARCLDIGGDDVRGLVDAAVAEDVGLVVVGPEAPLVAGLVDALEAAGVPAFGPSAAAARLEGSKVHAKEVMAAAGVPTASHVVLRDRDEALARLAESEYPTVLKADGLAAGKGVIIAASEEEARDAVELFFVEQRFGATEVVLEEHLDGEELSLLALCDGENVLPLAPAQDYKRIFDRDEGPNTGGMGSYSPVPEIDTATVEELTDEVHRPVVEHLARTGTPFHGVLYAGLMMTAAGPRVLEFNCRFGDPETQAVLPRLRSDLAEAVHSGPGARRPRGRERRLRRSLGGDGGARLGRLPGELLEGGRDLRLGGRGGDGGRRGDPRRHRPTRRERRYGRRPCAQCHRSRRRRG